MQRYRKVGNIICGYSTNELSPSCQDINVEGSQLVKMLQEKNEPFLGLTPKFQEINEKFGILYLKEELPISINPQEIELESDLIKKIEKLEEETYVTNEDLLQSNLIPLARVYKNKSPRIAYIAPFGEYSFEIISEAIHEYDNGRKEAKEIESLF